MLRVVIVLEVEVSIRVYIPIKDTEMRIVLIISVSHSAIYLLGVYTGLTHDLC